VIFDCHTHWGDCFRHRDGRNPAQWLGTLDPHGITHAIVLPFASLLDAGRIRADNDDIAAVCAASGGRMIPFCTVNTWFVDEAVTELTRCLGTLGHRGVKFHGWLQGQSASSPGMDEVCEIAAQHDVCVLFHDGTPPYSLPSQIALLALRHPRTQIVLGHCGLLDHWREAIAAMNAAPNLWGCLCGPHVAGMREILRRCDTQRLLWGSDFGFTFSDVIEYRLGILETLGLSDSLRRAILSDNPARLLSDPARIER
jgi:predicted TIM-barrel fold metal-dependent hydrolase